MPEVAGSPSTADRALLRAFLAWGDGDFERCSTRFSADWRARLQASWASTIREPPEAARAALRFEHESSARPDTSRVHPSWFVRAMQVESPAVRLSIAAHAPRPIVEALRRGLGIEPRDLRPDCAPDPEVLGWALALWSERLVGDVPYRDDDSAVVVAMTRLSFRELARTIKLCGLVKHAFAVENSGPTEFDESLVRFTPLDRVRFGYFRRHIATADPRLALQARLDLQAIEGDHRRGHARLGLLSFGRLLGSVESHRARWASQHLPYPIARLLRIKTKATLPRKALHIWETWVLDAATARLLGEGRISGPSANEKRSWAGHGVWQ